MNIDRPVSTIMTEHLQMVQPHESLARVKELLDTYNIHHMPVVDEKMVVGMLSKSDLNHFILSNAHERGEAVLEAAKLRAWTAGEVMTKNVVSISPKESIRRALEIFRNNRFHALPVIADNELVGIVTTFDILDVLLDESTVSHEFYKDSRWGKRSV